MSVLLLHNCFQQVQILRWVIVVHKHRVMVLELIQYFEQGLEL
jgi:hypothetical protein